MAYFRCGGGLPTQQKSITATTSQQIVLPDDGNVLEKVTVNPQKHSTTATPTTRTAQYNLGEYHTVRYINTNSVPNNNTQTKTITTRGSSIDLGGATHNYRYVDTSGVPSNASTYRTIWVNPFPWENFTDGYIDLDESMLNYSYIAIVALEYKGDFEPLTNDCPIAWVSASDFKDNMWKPIALAISGTCVRFFSGNSATRINVTSAYKIGSSGTDNSRIIPFEIHGYK